MKSIFLDTNIIIDLLAKREPYFQDAARIFTLSDRKVINLFVSALSFANVNYILSKQLTPEVAKLNLRKLNLLVNVLSFDSKIVNLSLNDNKFKDYEDSIQYYTAIENNMEAIISRNSKDFQSSKIPIFTASQFINYIKFNDL